MKIFYTSVLIISLIISGLSTFAQCPDCVPDETCIPEVAFPAICPEILPVATAGEYYETVITFYMPAELEDPESGFIVTLNQILVSGITGIPFGLSYELSGDDNIYYPSQGEQFGCATICGTPILPGEYSVNVNVVASVTVFGISQTLPQSFGIDLLVLPGEGGTNSFIYDNQAACDELSVQFEALINGSPNPTAWDWDFGNGNTSDQQIPPVQVYDEPGEYIATCTTIITEYFLQSVNVTSFWDNWSGDIEEATAFFFSPDPYFTLTDASNSPVYASSVIDDVTSASWNNLNIPLGNPPYTISFWDEDLISETDFLGSYEMPFSPGAFSFNANGTMGILTIEAIAGDPIYDEQIFTVFPDPITSFIVDGASDIITFDNPDLDTFLWFFNNDTINNANGPSLEMNNPGVYYCEVTNIYGCSGISEPYILCPEISILYNPFEETLSVSPGYETYTWFYNGLPLENEDENIISSYGLGNYAVTITTNYGCEVESSVYSITVGINEIDPFENLVVFPNPSSGLFQLRNLTSAPTWQVYDLAGRLITQSDISLRNEIDLRHLSSGVYVLNLQLNNFRKSLPLIIER